MEMEIPVLSFADLYGGKICAALDRQHPRDLFDIKLLSEAGGLNTCWKVKYVGQYMNIIISIAILIIILYLGV